MPILTRSQVFFAQQIAGRGTLFAIWQSKVYVTLLIMAAIIGMSGIFLWMYSPAWLPATWLIPAAALSSVGLAAVMWQKRGKICEMAFRENLFMREGQPVRALEMSH